MDACNTDGRQPTKNFGGSTASVVLRAYASSNDEFDKFSDDFGIQTLAKAQLEYESFLRTQSFDLLAYESDKPVLPKYLTRSNTSIDGLV